MDFDGTLIGSVLFAIALGLGASLILWLLRRYPLVQRVRFSVL